MIPYNLLICNTVSIFFYDNEENGFLQEPVFFHNFAFYILHFTFRHTFPYSFLLKQPMRNLFS